MDAESDQDIIKTLLKYKELAKNTANHPDMIKDATVLHFLAYVLDEPDEEILITSLDTIELLGQNSRNRPTIIRTFGVIQSLNYLALNESINNSIRERAKGLAELIRSPDGQSTGKVNKTERNKKLLTLHVCGLHEETRKDLEDILMKKVKGVHSVMVDVEHQRCIVTAYDNLDPKLLGKILSENTNMEAQLISKNKFNQEILVPLNENRKELDIELPAYLEEKESPVQEKAVRTMKEIRIVASEWFSVAADILQRSFYW